MTYEWDVVYAIEYMQQKTNQGWTSPSKINHSWGDVNQYYEKEHLNHVRCEANTNGTMCKLLNMCNNNKNQGWTSPSSKNNHGRMDVNQYSEEERLNHM